MKASYNKWTKVGTGWMACVCGLFIFQLAIDSSWAAQYQVDGVISATAFDENEKPRPEPMESHTFTLCVSNCTWEMTLKLSDESVAYYRKASAETGRPFTLPDYEKFTFDGTNLYCFSDYETAFGKFSAEKRAAGTPIAAAHDNRATASVIAQEVPHVTEGDSEIWLTYASACYFKNLTTNLAEVTWRWGFPETRGLLMPGRSVKRRANWILQQDPPGLPKSVLYYFKGGGNFTNAQFIVNSFTTFDGLTFPKESTLNVYRFDPKAQSSTNVIISSRYIIKALAFRKFNKAFDFPPPLPVLTAVTDHRFNSPSDLAPETSVPYIIEGRFLTKEEARDSHSYTEYKVKAANGPVTHDSLGNRYTRIRVSIIGIMIISSIVFLAVAVRNRCIAEKKQ